MRKQYLCAVHIKTMGVYPMHKTNKVVTKSLCFFYHYFISFVFRVCLSFNRADKKPLSQTQFT